MPLFALANAGVVLNGSFLAQAYTAPITLGVMIGYVAGKPVAVMLSSWLVTRLSHGKIVPPIGWAAVLGSGTIAGIGFTAALLIATRAFTGQDLAEAKLGALSAVVIAAGLTWGVLRVTQLLPAERRARLLLGDTRLIQDLIPAVDPDHDHIRGPKQALLTVIEFGDFECPYCGQAEPVVRDILTDTTIRYVWRHLPLTDVHPRAQIAAEATEAAAAQDAFWPMHDLLLQHQDALTMDDLSGYAESLGLDVDRFDAELERHDVRDPGGPGPGVGRPVRGVRHPDVLHQWPAPLRRLRPADPDRGDPGRARTGHHRHRPGLGSGRGGPQRLPRRRHRLKVTVRAGSRPGRASRGRRPG